MASPLNDLLSYSARIIYHVFCVFTNFEFDTMNSVSYNRNCEFVVFSVTTRRRCFQNVHFLHRHLQQGPIIDRHKFGYDLTFHRKVIRVVCCESWFSPTLPPFFLFAVILIEKILIPLDPQLVHSDLTKFEGDPMKVVGQVCSNTVGAKWPKSAKNLLSIQDGSFPVRFRA